jgi:hypothetical protein
LSALTADGCELVGREFDRFVERWGMIGASARAALPTPAGLAAAAPVTRID